MANSADSTAADRGSPNISSVRLVPTFPRHDTVKLDEGSFMQWQQHIRLIVEGYELLGYLEGTIPAPPRFISSPDDVLTLNPDASIFIQQDKLFASWLLSIISSPLLSCFIAVKFACDVRSTTNHLFAVATGAKLSRIRHDLHSIKKGTMPVKNYIVKIQNTCALLKAPGSTVPEAEKVEITLVDLLSEFDTV